MKLVSSATTGRRGKAVVLLQLLAPRMAGDIMSVVAVERPSMSNPPLATYISMSAGQPLLPPVPQAATSIAIAIAAAVR